MAESVFKFNHSSLDAMKKDCRWPDNYTASAAFLTIIANESLTTDPILAVMFNFIPQEFYTVFEKPKAGLRNYYANEAAIFVITSAYRSGKPIEFKSYQSKFRALLLKVLGRLYFIRSISSICKDLGVCPSPTDLVPDYEKHLAHFEISEEELLDALNDFDTNYDGPIY